MYTERGKAVCEQLWEETIEALQFAGVETILEMQIKTKHS